MNSESGIGIRILALEKTNKPIGHYPTWFNVSKSSKIGGKWQINRGDLIILICLLLFGDDANVYACAYICQHDISLIAQSPFCTMVYCKSNIHYMSSALAALGY